MNKLRKTTTIFALLYFIILVVYLFYDTYSEIKKKQVSNFNSYQLQIARSAAKNIETYFHYFAKRLNEFSKDPDIINLTTVGKKKMETFLKENKSDIRAVTRVDKNGKIAFTVPFEPDFMGAYVLNQKHNQKVFKTHKPVVSDVLKIVQGYYAVVYAYPMFKNGKFDGTLALVIPFANITKRFVSNIKVGKNGYAWIINKEGIEIYCPISSHIGKSVFKTSKDFSSVINLVKHILTSDSEQEGTSFYYYNQIKNNHTKSIKKYAAYVKIKLPDTYWVIIVATPESQVMASLQSFKHKWLLNLSLFAIGLIVIFYVIFKTWILLEEEKKRKSTEKHLFETRKIMHDVIENLPLGILIIDSNNKIEYINKKFKGIYGYSLSDIPDIDTLIEKLYPEDDRQLEEGKIWKKNIKAKKSSTMKNIFTSKVRCKDGVYKYASIRINHIGNKITVIFQDITTKYEKEELEKQLAEKNARDQKMQAIGLMAGGVAHDLNNILTGMVTYPEMILMDMDKTHPLYEDMNEIYNAGKRAALIVNDLVTVARGIASKREIFNLNAVIKETLDSIEFKNIINNYDDIKVTFKPAYNLLNTEGSISHIRKTLFNLVMNAAEAMPRGGEIKLETSNIYVEKQLNVYEVIPRGEYVVLKVKDTGTGISNEDLKRIFEPFYTKKFMNRKSGTGLGLAIVWNTMRDHNGYIDVKSSSEGTVFTLYFPASREIVVNESENFDREKCKGNGEVILVVDDEERQLNIAQKILTKLNYKVYTVSSGELAVEYVKKHDVDLILLDMMMEPGINGRETYERIVRFKPSQKAVIVSGYAQNDEVLKARNLGVGSYVQKPYTMADLCVAINAEFKNKN